VSRELDLRTREATSDGLRKGRASKRGKIRLNMNDGSQAQHLKKRGKGGSAERDYPQKSV